MSLHDELQRLADTAPRPSIDHTVWDRGRALRRRDRLITSAVVLVMVLIVGGLGSLVLDPPRLVAPASDPVPEGAIPSLITDVPADVDLPLEKDLAIGQASVAFVSSSGLPVVVGASDGVYHPLDLPGWMADSILEISPSGDRLAWLSKPGAYGASTMRVLTLRTGEIFQPGVSRGAALKPIAVSWSPDGIELAWLGEQPSGSLYYGIRLEEAVPTNRAVVHSHQTGLVGVAVANDGTLALGTSSGGLLLDADERDSRMIPDIDGRPTNFSPDGTVLALENQLIPSPMSSTLEVATGRHWRHPFPADTLGPATTRPLGWLDDRLQLILAQESFDDDAELVITTPKLGQTSTWRHRVGFVDPAVVASLSVAVDLVPDLDGTSSQRFTRDFGEPEWPGEDPDRLPLVLGGLMALLAGLAYLRMLRHQG